MDWEESLKKAGGDLFGAHLEHAVEVLSPTASQRVPAVSSPAANQSASDQAAKRPKTVDEARNTAEVATSGQPVKQDWKKWAAIGGGGLLLVGLLVWGIKK